MEALALTGSMTMTTTTNRTPVRYVDTQRLPPVTGLRTKYCEIEVDAKGGVLATWLDGHQLWVAPGGRRVRTLRGKNGHFVAPIEHGVDTLNCDLLDRYEHIRKHVNEYRSRVVRVEYRTQYCTCQWMEDDPADFHCVFHDRVVAGGLSLHLCQRLRYLKLVVNDRRHLLKLRERDLGDGLADIVTRNMDVICCDPTAAVAGVRDNGFGEQGEEGQGQPTTEGEPVVVNPTQDGKARLARLTQKLFPLLLHAEKCRKRCAEIARAPEAFLDRAVIVGGVEVQPGTAPKRPLSLSSSPVVKGPARGGTATAIESVSTAQLRDLLGKGTVTAEHLFPITVCDERTRSNGKPRMPTSEPSVRAVARARRLRQKPLLLPV